MQNIDLYYESIKQVYDQIADWQEPKPPLQERIVDWLLGIALVAFFLSLIPIFPVIIVYISGQIGWTFGPIDLSGATFGNFILVWGSTTIVFGTLFGVMAWLNNKVDSSREKPTGPPQKLSSEQLTFIAFYESYKQLKMFFVSHVDQHVDKSLKAFSTLRIESVYNRQGLQADNDEF